MNVLFLQEQPCIRALKYAKGLRAYLKKINLYFGYCGRTLDEFYGEGNELFDGWYKVNDHTAGSLKKIVNRIEPDIIHCHNAPDTLTQWSIKLFGGRYSIVHDIHDLLSIRNTMYDDGLKRNGLTSEKIVQEEKAALENSDGIIAVSEAIFDIAFERYKLDSRRCLVFPNCVAGDMLPASDYKKLSKIDGMIHMVYEGHLDGNRNGGHYDLFDMFTEISRQGINIHIYPSRDTPLYRNFSKNESLIHYHETVSPARLLSELTKYDFGWAGFNCSKNSLHTDTVIANKTVEYIAAGIPVVSLPHRSQKLFIEQNCVGIVIDDISELSRRLGSRVFEDARKNVLEKRSSFTIEKQIGKLYEFYKKILGLNNNLCERKRN